MDYAHSGGQKYPITRPPPPAHDVPRCGGIGRVRIETFKIPPDPPDPHGKSHRQKAAGAARRGRTQVRATSCRAWDSSGSAGHTSQSGPGKPQIILRVCELRKKGMGIRPIMRKLKQAYSTVRDWLLRMMGTDLDRRHDKQRGRKKKKLDAAARKAILEWVDNSPRKYGFCRRNVAAGHDIGHAGKGAERLVQAADAEARDEED